MKKWMLILLSLLGFAWSACVLNTDTHDLRAPEVRDDSDAGTDVEAHAEALTILCSPDLAAKQAVKFYFNADDSELHWYTNPNYWQVGGAAFHQTVRGRGYMAKSVNLTRTIKFASCGQGVCFTNGDVETCGCSYSSCHF